MAKVQGWMTINKINNSREGGMYRSENAALASKYWSRKFNYLRTPEDKEAACADVRERYHVVPLVISPKYEGDFNG